MQNRSQKNFLLRILFNQKILSLLIIACLIWLFLPLIKNIKQRRSVDKEMEELQEEIKRVEGKNNDLQKLLGYLGSEQFAEEQARINFGLKKEGEEVVVMQSGGGDSATKSSSSQIVFNIPGIDNAKTERAESNPEKWFKYFFNN